ncbi:LYR motif-containing protein 4B [Tetrabaena socialis]|uniref:LYR motif-containing protein 4B n=1 Tax=Tetrabaena socialis TaxID=47790 RepID=A0A2J8A4Z1_9CHLO|nr:LYR motif-containing protein 4B [Tetrabaena socialis]|eukprot:PNH07589.1 LYR motif-containing protein 4B [Tetrabaena socialis]
MSTAMEARSLFRALVREGRRFPNYNLREYIQRRAREGFRESSSVADPAVVKSLLQSGRQELEVVKRQSVVYQLFARKFKNVLELDMDVKQGGKA